MINRLAINLGLEDYDPFTAFQIDPCGETLSHSIKDLSCKFPFVGMTQNRGLTRLNV